MTRAERKAIAKAIAGAEDGTTGRIAVRIIPDATVDAFERAKREFERAGLHRHEGANAVLILVAPNAQRFAVLGDRALHERVGDPFWHDVVEKSRQHFQRGDLLGGVVYAVGRISEAYRAA